MIELIGWVASMLIVASLSMTSILKLRLLGLAGAATFAVYGALVEAWPVAAVNTVIVGIHLWFLRTLLRRSSGSFWLLEVAASSDYLRGFLDFYADEIGRFFPEYRFVPAEHQVRVFVLRDMVPAGLIVGTWEAGDRMRVELDFAIPQHSDLRLGRFAFSAASGLTEGKGRVVVSATAATDVHRDYLTAIGFEPVGDSRFEKAIHDTRF